MTDRNAWKPLTAPYKAAIRAYERESHTRLLDRDAHDAVTVPLYHYTDARGLEGIITAQQIWFTHYQQLNDPTELEFGMTVAKAVLAEVGGRTGGPVKIFCEMMDDLFSIDNLRAPLEVYIASFSRNGDDLRQWQVYAANGRGFA